MRQGEGKGSLLIFQSVVKGGVNDHTFSGPAFVRVCPSPLLFALVPLTVYGQVPIPTSGLMGKVCCATWVSNASSVTILPPIIKEK